MRDCTVPVAKTKKLVGFAVTVELICTFGFSYADCWFSHEAAHFLKALAAGVDHIQIFMT